MSYAARRQSLGYDMIINVPGVGQQHVDVPLEQMVEDAGVMVMEQARTNWVPEFQQTMLPPILAQVEQEFAVKVMPQLQTMMDNTVNTLQLRVVIMGVGLAGIWWAAKLIRERQ